MWPSYSENARNHSFPSGALSIYSVARGIIWELFKHFALFCANQFLAYAQDWCLRYLVVCNAQLWLYAPSFSCLHCFCVLPCCSSCRPLLLLLAVATILDCQCWSFLSCLTSEVWPVYKQQCYHEAMFVPQCATAKIFVLFTTWRFQDGTIAWLQCRFLLILVCSVACLI